MFGFDPSNPGDSIPSLAGDFKIPWQSSKLICRWKDFQEEICFVDKTSLKLAKFWVLEAFDDVRNSCWADSSIWKYTFLGMIHMNTNFTPGCPTMKRGIEVRNHHHHHHHHLRHNNSQFRCHPEKNNVVLHFFNSWLHLARTPSIVKGNKSLRIKSFGLV